jgi:hypothetical protein
MQPTIVIFVRRFGWSLTLPSGFNLELKLHNVFLELLYVCLRRFQRSEAGATVSCAMESAVP